MTTKETTSNGYELVVRSLLQSRLKDQGLGDLKSFHLKKYLGKSGQLHEIDVSFEVQLGEIFLLFVVECKEYTRRVGVDDIMAFSYRIQDIGAHKGLLVTTTGFQEGAVKVAKAEGIGLLTVAQGRIVTWWLGAAPSYFEFWIDRFYLDISKGGLELRAGRIVTMNSTWRPERLTFGEVLNTETPIAFLLPNEESALDVAYDDKDEGGLPFGRELHFGRPIQRPEKSDEFTIV